MLQNICEEKGDDKLQCESFEQHSIGTSTSWKYCKKEVLQNEKNLNSSLTAFMP